MNNDELRRELLALTTELGEQLNYFRALGAEGLEVSDAPEIEQSAGSSTESEQVSLTADAQPVSQHLSTSRALERNARAEEKLLTSQPVQAPTVPADLTDMAKRTTRKNIDDAAASTAPPPQETLFGVITPKDELSLPRPNETLEDIWADIGDCTRCPLHLSRTHVVNSEGNRKARLMFVGEAPGADEDAQARPFIGRAGQLLNKIIEAIGMKREEVFIGNVNRCRPPQNRTPTPAEAATCKPFLLREIAIVQPEVIVVLGNTAMKNLLDTKEGITKLRGQFQDYRGIKVMPTFHPAYLLRDPTKKRETWKDMKKVREYLDKTKS
jgi:DNA polymerase